MVSYSTFLIDDIIRERKILKVLYVKSFGLKLYISILRTVWLALHTGHQSAQLTGWNYLTKPR